MATATTSTQPRPKIALVLPGGGARGAYEAGALSVLLPALEARGEQVSIVCGTSVGAINAAFLASVADLPAAAQVAQLLARWRQMRKSDVIKPVVGIGLPQNGLRVLAQLLQVPNVRVSSLMDPSPLSKTLQGWLDWDALKRNLDTGAMDAVCIVATALSRGGPVGFVHSRGELPTTGPTDALRYVSVPAMLPEHIRASAAIPLLFPPVKVTSPESAADFYIDGGTRLNAPIAPAMALGAERVIVIGFDPFSARTPKVEPVTNPHMADVLANVMQGLLVDQVADDVHRLAAINSFLVEDGGLASAPKTARLERKARGKPPYKRVSYALVAPAEHGTMAAVADEVFAQRYGGWKAILHPDFPVVSRLLGGKRARASGELLSMLLFDEVFVERLIEKGAADAQLWIDRHPKFWCSDAAHDLHVDAVSAAGAEDHATIDEWRSLRRR